MNALRLKEKNSNDKAERKSYSSFISIHDHKSNSKVSGRMKGIIEVLNRSIGTR